MPTGRRLRPLLPIVLLVGAWVSLVQASGANQAAHYALVRALDEGTPVIDRWRFETPDVSWYDGHYYSVKAPGLALGTLPWYAALDGTGVADAAQRAGERAAAREEAEQPGRRAAAVRAQRAVVWLLQLWAVILPAAAMLLIVRAVAERVAPGTGTAVAVLLGLGTLVLPYATMLYAHVPAAALVAGAFALLWRERERAPRPAIVALAGLLAGLAALVEYPSALAGAVVGLYALSHPRARAIPRGLAYAGGVLAGIAPLALYNLWAFGSVTHLSYDDAVAVEGASGHDELGLNDAGLFGVELPSPAFAADLLLAPKGLFALTPVVLAALWGVVALYRGGRRAEALTIGGVALATFLYNAGYYLPYGGDVPGPRFLLVALPFVAIGLAVALRERPLPTLALGAASAFLMVVATATEPQLIGQDVGRWARMAADGDFQYTVLGAVTGGHGWLNIAPFVLLALAAAVLAVRDLRPSGGDVVPALLVLAGWAAVALAIPPLLDDRSAGGAVLVALAAAAGAATVLIVARGSRSGRATRTGTAPAAAPTAPMPAGRTARG